MIIEIIDWEKMQIKSGIHFLDGTGNLPNKYEVLSMHEDCFHKFYLVLFEELPFWVKDGKYLIKNGVTPIFWKKLKKYKYLTEEGTYAISNITAPSAFIDDKELFGEIIFNNKIAFKKIKSIIND